MGRISIEIDIRGRFGAFKKLEKNVKRMSRTMKKMGNTVNRTTKKIRNNFMQTSKSSQAMGNKLGFIAFQWTFIATQAQMALRMMIDGLSEVIRKGAEFQDKVIRSLAFAQDTAELAAGSFEKMAETMDLLNKFGRGQTALNLGEVAEILGELNKAIDDTAASAAILPFAIKFRIIEPDISAEQLAVKMTNIVKSIGIDPTDVSKLSAGFDAVLNIMNKSTLGIDSAIASLALSAPVMKQASFTLAETGAALAIAADALGLKEKQKAGRNLIAFATDMRKAVKPGTDFAKMLAGLDVELFDQNDKFIGLANSIRAIKQGMEKLTGKPFEELSDKQRQKFFAALGFTARAIRVFSALIEEGADKIEEKVEAIKERGGLDTLSTFISATSGEQQIKKIEAAIDSLKFDLVNGLAPALNEIAKIFSSFSSSGGVQDFFTEIGQILGEEVVPVIRAAVTLLKKLTKGIGGNERLLRPFVKVVLALAAAMAGLFIFATITAMAALMGTVLEKLAITSLLARIGIGRLFIGLAGLAIGLIGTSIVISELKKDIEDMDRLSIAAGASMTGLGIILATKVHPALGAIVAIISLLALSIQEFQTPGSLAAAFDKLLGIDQMAMNFSTFRKMNEAYIHQAEHFIGELMAAYVRGGEAVGNALFVEFPKAIGAAFLAMDTFQKEIGDIIAKSVNGAITTIVAMGSTIAGALFIGFRDFFSPLFDIRKLIIDAITDALTSIFEAGAMIGEQLMEGIKSNLNLDLAGLIGQGGADLLGGLGDFISGGIKSLFGGVPEAFGELADTSKKTKDALNAQDISVKLAKVTTDRLNATTEILSKSDEFLTIATDKISQFYNDPFQKELDFNMKGLNINTNELQLLQNAFEALRQAVRELEAKIRRTRVKFEKNDDGKIIGFKLIGGISKAEIESLAEEAFAHGGIVTKPTVGLIGEAGPEAVIPLNKLDKLISGAGGARTITFENNITIEGGANVTGDELVEKLSDKILEDIERKIDLK